jgi:ribonuclease HI
MIKIFIDGASAGNPGKIGVGYLIYKEDNLIKKESIPLGIQTNNFAEYMALIFALTEAINIREEECHVFSDSQLLCEQINGNYKVKNNNIYPLFILAKKLISRYDKFKISHISRDKNKEADTLAKKAVSFLT